MQQEEKPLWPEAFDADMAGFCNFMLMTARTDDAKRMFWQVVAEQKARALADQSPIGTSVRKPSSTPSVACDAARTHVAVRQ